MLLNCNFIKVKLEPRETSALDHMYDLLFKVLNAGWAGSTHRAYTEHVHGMICDGWIYGFVWQSTDQFYTLSADASWVKQTYPKAEWTEVTAQSAAEYLKIKAMVETDRLMGIVVVPSNGLYVELHTSPLFGSNGISPGFVDFHLRKSFYDNTVVTSDIVEVWNEIVRQHELFVIEMVGSKPTSAVTKSYLEKPTGNFIAVTKIHPKSGDAFSIFTVYKPNGGQK